MPRTESQQIIYVERLEALQERLALDPAATVTIEGKTYTGKDMFMVDAALDKARGDLTMMQLKNAGKNPLIYGA